MLAEPVRRLKSEVRQRQYVASTRLTPTEYRELECAARKAGRSVSAHLRFLIVGTPEIDPEYGTLQP